MKTRTVVQRPAMQEPRFPVVGNARPLRRHIGMAMTSVATKMRSRHKGEACCGTPCRRALSLLLTDRNLSVNMTFSRDRLRIETNSPEIGEAKDEIPVRCDADELKVSFNPIYLMDPLRQLDVDDVTLEISDYTSPGVLRTNSMNFLYVLMPMRYRAAEDE